MLCDKLKKLREDRGLQPKDVAEFLGITRQGYCRYEDNKSDLSTSNLSKLADFYGVSTDYLLGRDEKKLTEDVTAMTDNELDKALIQAYMSMSETDKRGIRNYILEIFDRINELEIKEDNSSKFQQPQVVVEKPSPLIVQSKPQCQQPVQKLPSELVQTPPQMVQNTNSIQPVQREPQRQWRKTARTFDGRYESRPATPEEIEKLRQMADEPEPDF